MPETQYTPKPYIFASKGLSARTAVDRVPPGGYLNLKGMYERQEDAMSSRYGSQIVNRDPDSFGSGTNYYLPSPIQTITRLKYNANTYRYAGSGDTLYRRTGDVQGPYTAIYTGLSGNPFGSASTSCFGSSLNYLFIADQNAMLKDSGTGLPTQWGITTPNQTANATEMGPELLLIDGFTDPIGDYALNNVSGWASTPIGDVNVTSESPWNNFAQFGSDASLLVAFNGALATPSDEGGDLTQSVIFNIYDTPNPPQFSSIGVDASIPSAATSFSLNSYSGDVAANTTATVGRTVNIDLSQNYQVTDDDLIAICLQLSDPGAIQQINLMFDVNNSGYTSSYYTKSISPAYYQSGIAGDTDAYTTASSEILALSLGLLTGSTTGQQNANQIIQQLQSSTANTGSNAWSTIYSRRGDFLAVGNAGEPGYDWSSITGWQVQIITTTNASVEFAINGLYLQWGAGPSSFGGVGYDYRYIYYNANTQTPSNPCVTADTWVHTSDGPRRVQDLIGHDFRARVNGRDYQTQCGGFFATGFKPVFELSTVNGYRVKTTADHKILKVKSSSKWRTETEWVAVSDLRPGDRVCLHNHRGAPDWMGFGDEDDGYLIGALLGDGNFNAANGRAILAFNNKYDGNDSMIREVERILRKKGVAAQFKGGHRTKKAHIFDSRYVRSLANSLGMFPGDGNKTITDAIEKCSSAFYRGFLRGFFDADGTATEITDKRDFAVRLSQSNWKIIAATQRMLLRFGISSSIHSGKEGRRKTYLVQGEVRECHCEITHSLCVSADNLEKFTDEIGFLHEKKCSRLAAMRNARKKNAVRENFFAKVKEVVSCGEEQVFDVTVPSVHCFDANGIVTHNCSIQYFSQQYGFVASYMAPIVLRQGINITGIYSSDPQVTHVQIFRRGGSLAENWYYVDQFPNITGGGTFSYIDVIPDLALAQSNILQLDNDPPVTSTLQNPITTALSAPTIGPGMSPYSQFAPQAVTVTDPTATFLPNQTVVVGSPYNLEETQVITGGVGTFTAILRLTHAIGEQVQAFSVPQQPCDLVGVAYGQNWVAGDPNNPHYLYYSKKGYPENFGPQRYIPVGTPQSPINAIITDYRGTLYVGTLTTWYQIVPGNPPYPQSTGSRHGIVSKTGWAQAEGSVWYLALDGVREFRGADGPYRSLPIEWIFRDVPLTPVPLVDNSQISTVSMAFWRNGIYSAYTALDQTRNRLVWDTNYARWRNDDVPALAMYLEEDTQTLLYSKFMTSGSQSGYAIVQGEVGDYDDGGWVNDALVKIPINMDCQLPYQDVGAPHYPKQWNVFEVDANTNGQTVTLKLNFDDGIAPLTLGTFNTTERQKIQFNVNSGDGVESYKCSPELTAAVTVAPYIYQINAYADTLAANRTSLDVYFWKFGTEETKFVKEVYFDYTAAAPVALSFYVDGNDVAYYTATLPARPDRAVIRVRLPALMFRTWRLIALSDEPMQNWSAPRCKWKPVNQASGYQAAELPT